MSDLGTAQLLNKCSDQTWNQTPCKGCHHGIDDADLVNKVTNDLRQEGANAVCEFIESLLKHPTAPFRYHDSIFKLICHSVCFVYENEAEVSNETLRAIMMPPKPGAPRIAWGESEKQNYAYVGWTPFCKEQSTEDGAALQKWGAWMVHASSLTADIINLAIAHVASLCKNVCTEDAPTLYVVYNDKNHKYPTFDMPVKFMNDVKGLPPKAKYIVIVQQLTNGQISSEETVDGFVHAAYIHNVRYSRSRQVTAFETLQQEQPNRKRVHDTDDAESVIKRIKKDPRFPTLPLWVHEK